MNDLDPTPQPQGEPEPPESEAQWRWALRTGWRLAKRRPHAWLMTVLVSLGLGLSESAFGDALGLAEGGWGRLGLGIGLTFVAWVWSDVTFLRLIAGELDGPPVTWGQAQVWAFARIGRCWSLWIRGAIALASWLVLTALVMGQLFPERVGEARSINPVAFQIAIYLGGIVLGSRLANLSTYYLVQGSGFRSSARLAWRASKSHWASYLALALLGFLPSLPQLHWTLANPRGLDIKGSPAYFVSLGLGSLIAPWFEAAYLLLWLRNGEGTSLEAFG